MSNDYDTLRGRVERFLRDRPHAQHVAYLRMADAMVTDLWAEVERLTSERDRHAAHARSLGEALDNTFKDRDDAQANADRLRRTLAVVLACFTARAHLGEAGDCLRTGWVQARTVDTWRKLVEVTRG